MARPRRSVGNLPAEVTSFVGRRHDLAEIRRRLTEAPLVTLVGPGGVGKTRLAVRAATDLARGFPDGTWLVELADVREPGLVGHAVLAALDLRDQAAAEPVRLLLGYLRERRLLLVVDNCEHLLAATAGLLARVVRAAPGVRVLATSRQPLTVPGEHVLPVAPLDLPAPGEPLDRLRHNDSVRLFVDRAAAGTGTFPLTEANQATVADLCRRLDGLPLAIELAAVRTRVLSVQQILDRLTDRFTLLTGGGPATLPRHQTLRTTLDWSHDLLSAGEAALLRRLCVFAGRFTIDDVEGVCADDGVPALDALSSLVDKSLVLKEDAGTVACYHLHETMREYARLKLREAGEEDAVESRCARYYRDACRRSAPDARYRLVEWLAWMDLEIDNIRAVLHRCVARRDGTAGLDLACLIGWYWITRATGEGVQWLDRLLDLAGDEVPAHAAALFMRGFLAVLQTDPAAAVPALRDAAAAARAAGQVSLHSQALSMAAVAAHMAGDRASAAHLLDRAYAVGAELGDYFATIALHQARSLNGLFDGDPAAVRPAASEGVRIGREAADLYSLEVMLANLGFAALIDRDPGTAGPLFVEALRIARRIDDRVATYVLLDALGCHAAGTGDPRRAARLLGAAGSVQASVGAGALPNLVPLVGQATSTATTALGTATFRAEYEAGRALGRDAAIRLALGEPPPGTPAAPTGTVPSPLGRREAEIAELVAQGLTNKQIAARLVLSEHTVDTHIRNILTKLGYRNRAQIAAWVTATTV